MTKIVKEQMTMAHILKKFEGLQLSGVQYTETKILLDFAYRIGRESMKEQVLEILHSKSHKKKGGE